MQDCPCKNCLSNRCKSSVVDLEHLVGHPHRLILSMPKPKKPLQGMPPSFSTQTAMLSFLPTHAERHRGNDPPAMPCLPPCQAPYREANEAPKMRRSKMVSCLPNAPFIDAALSCQARKSADCAHALLRTMFVIHCRAAIKGVGLPERAGALLESTRSTL